MEAWYGSIESPTYVPRIDIRLCLRHPVEQPLSFMHAYMATTSTASFGDATARLWTPTASSGRGDRAQRVVALPTTSSVRDLARQVSGSLSTGHRRRQQKGAEIPSPGSKTEPASGRVDAVERGDDEARPQLGTSTLAASGIEAPLRSLLHALRSQSFVSRSPARS